MPYPVINRAIFGVKGANIPAIIRGLIAVAWYGVQTYLAAESLNIIFLKFIPASQALTEVELPRPERAGLDLLRDPLGGPGGAVLDRHGDDPQVHRLGGSRRVRRHDHPGDLPGEQGRHLATIDLNLHSGESLGFWASIPVMITAIAIVVSYFSGPMLNFGDFSRYGRSFAAVKKGNFLGLPVNFLFFSLLTVITASATVPVFGELITDPIKTVQRIDTPFAILLGGLTFVTATVGINIVANFISPAFDFSNVNPQKISWRTGGMIAAVGSVLLTPWNWYDNDQAIHYTLGLLGSLIGPLFGILIAGYYLAAKQRIAVDDMYTMSPTGLYWFKNGWNPNAVMTMAATGVVAILLSLFTSIGDFGWFIGCGLGFAMFALLERTRPMIPVPTADAENVSDGATA